MSPETFGQSGDMQTYGAVRGLIRSEGFSDAVFAITLTLLSSLPLTVCTWMAKCLYGMPGRRVMDERLAPAFLLQMTRRYAHPDRRRSGHDRGTAGRRGGLLCVAFFLLPQPTPRCKPRQVPSKEEKLKE